VAESVGELVHTEAHPFEPLELAVGQLHPSPVERSLMLASPLLLTPTLGPVLLVGIDWAVPGSERTATRPLTTCKPSGSASSEEPAGHSTHRQAARSATHR